MSEMLQPVEEPYSDADWYSGAVPDMDGEGEISRDELIEIAPSQFVEFSLRLPVGGKIVNFSFEGREYMRPIYDSNSQRILLVAGRQVEKSTLLGNKALAYVAMNPGFRVLYVSPSHTQTKVFSRDRIKEPIDASNVLRAFTSTKMLSNVLEKKFLNYGSITLRFAFLNADRVRGLPADLILIDEFQDILLDNVPVIEQCASHSLWKLFCLSGTPKSLDGSLEVYWTKYSTQNEWVVPCKRHGTPKDPSSWHWNVLDESSIGLRGLICERCGGLIKANDPDSQWASLNPEPNVLKPYEGYRIPQLMVPWIDWDDILHNQKHYSRQKFHNEVLGRSYDSGTRPLTRQQMTENCNERLSMNHYKKVAEKYSGGTPIFMGVDWGTGEGSYTVMSLAGYMPWDPNFFTYFYLHQFAGLESEPERQLEVIIKTARAFNVAVIGVDYGGGYWPNDELIRTFGAEKVKRYQWLGNPKYKLRYEPRLGIPRFVCHRTEVMSDYFNAIKRRNVFRFPRWEEFKEPFASDFLNIYSEYNERLRFNIYKHSPGCPDDTAHSCIYSFLASFFHRKRADVVLPTKEAAREYVEGEEDHDAMENWDIELEKPPPSR